MRNTLSGLVWVLLYLLFCLAPLLLAIGQNTPPGRPFFVGLSILALQFALIARFKAVAAPFGIDALLQYHVQITFVALAFVLAHPLPLFAADSKYLPLLNLLTAPWRARFAFTSVIALLVLAGLSVWRRRVRLSYEWWQATHGLLAVAVVLFALLHASLVGYYVTGCSGAWSTTVTSAGSSSCSCGSASSARWPGFGARGAWCGWRMSAAVPARW